MSDQSAPQQTTSEPHAGKVGVDRPMDPASIEREIKVRGTDLEIVEEKLRQLDARRLQRAYWECNWVLDRDGELLARARLLRIRERRYRDGQPSNATITVKAPLRPVQQSPPADPASSSAADPTAQPPAPLVKERIERETNVESAASALEMFSLLGFRPVRRYHKVRSKWLFRQHQVLLDHTPMGNFVEVEGPDPRLIAEELSLPVSDFDARNYLAIYDEHRQRVLADSAGKIVLPPDMLFDHGAPPGFRGASSSVAEPSSTAERSSAHGAEPAGG